MSEPLPAGLPIGGAAGRSRWRKTIGWTLAVLGLAGVIAIAFAGRDAFAQAFEAGIMGHPFMLGGIVLLTFGNVIATSVALVMPTRAIAGKGGRPCGLPEMTALVSVASVMNYLPMRPGMIGRLAYHRREHAVPLRGSAGILLGNAIITATLSIAGVLALAPSLTGVPAPIGWLLAMGLVGAAVIGVNRRRGRMVAAWIWPAVALARAIDLACWAGRYALVFAAVGLPLDIGTAVLYAAAVQAVLVLPIAGNGLGAREAAIGLIAVAAQSQGSLPTMELLPTAVAADVLHRAVEVAATGLVGLTGFVWLARLQHGLRLVNASNEPTENVTAADESSDAANDQAASETARPSNTSSA